MEIALQAVNKTTAVNTINSSRTFAPLSEARALKEGKYWINAKGAPTTAGHYRDNKNGTFTKISDGNSVDWADCLYVSEQAAYSASRYEGPLLLEVGNHAARLCLFVGEWHSGGALIASVPQARVDQPSRLAQLVNYLRDAVRVGPKS
jgi:hypothetical protein